jgi:hypothetical protein
MEGYRGVFSMYPNEAARPIVVDLSDHGDKVALVLCSYCTFLNISNLPNPKYFCQDFTKPLTQEAAAYLCRALENSSTNDLMVIVLPNVAKEL